MRLSKTLLATAALAGALALAGCGREADKAARADTASAAYTGSNSDSTRVDSPATRTSYAPRRGLRPDDGPRFADGKPQWASNRTRSGDENAQLQFQRNGKDFGAGSLDDYVAKAHAFVGDPPKGVLTLTRANGDELLYDPKANVFAVADRQGAPRTMFKPRDGMAYWTQQKDRASEQDSGASSDSSSRPSRRYRAKAQDNGSDSSDG